MRYFITLLLLAIFLFVCRMSYARTELTLSYKAQIQEKYIDPEGDEWRTTVSKSFTAIGGLQFMLRPESNYRLKLIVTKPYDIAGKLRVRTPTRMDGILSPAGTDKAVIIFGNQEGCDEPRCKPLNLNDVGNIELRMELDEAQHTSFGIMLFRPYATELPFAVRIALKYKDKHIACGSQVKKGWWIFASSMTAEAVQLGTVSLCVSDPDGEVKCAPDQEEVLKIKINKKGIYNFVAWNTSPKFMECYVEAK